MFVLSKCALLPVCARWRADQDGPNGITPLHLAALQEDARLALALLDICPEQAFTKLVTRDGECRAPRTASSKGSSRSRSGLDHATRDGLDPDLDHASRDSQ